MPWHGLPEILQACSPIITPSYFVLNSKGLAKVCLKVIEQQLTKGKLLVDYMYVLQNGRKQNLCLETGL